MSLWVLLFRGYSRFCWKRAGTYHISECDSQQKDAFGQHVPYPFKYILYVVVKIKPPGWTLTDIIHVHKTGCDWPSDANWVMSLRSVASILFRRGML